MDEKETTRELVVVDVKRYKKVKRALLDSEERYRQLFENVPIGIYRTTPGGQIVDANPALVKMLGYESFDELAARNLEKDFFDTEYPRAHYLAILEHEGEIKGSEAVWRKKDGSMIHVRENVKSTSSPDGEVFFEGTIEDISERKEAETKLLAYQEQLRALTSELTLIEEKERRRIACEIHDQIGQNLALCKLKVAAMEKNMPKAAMKLELAAVRRLLECSIQDARSLIFDLSPPVLYELGFTAALEWLAERIQEQFHVPVEFESRFGDPELDNDRQVILFQVVRELLVNVGKHSQASQAKVILSHQEPFLKIQVNDDGVGFDASRIFSPKDQNSGFGFFSMRERLNYLGGGLEVKSKPGKGSQIILTVPLPGPGLVAKKENS
ncbi:MAG: PAS domain S-box protein [Acidobacteria bacterium]|nr:PAS domain S-box protein [Acidobacteriota bacterium]MBU4306491.1 PAS domain S-box protein [Acidobacteriota bacterium]MBU4404320.1 PAS domain S-box protein [Acidobacteriota bacterium]MCG2812424.1 PAS domain S-box protein [Candidatus Aminicenantes bacterium]